MKKGKLNTQRSTLNIQRRTEWTGSSSNQIRFRVEPDFYFIGHKSSPAFGLPVRPLAIPARG
jgi:hypothetical protein